MRRRVMYSSMIQSTASSGRMFLPFYSFTLSISGVWSICSGPNYGMPGSSVSITIRLSGWRNWRSFITGYWYGIFGLVGITCGAHRLWSHKSYKATLPLRIFLMMCQSLAGQNDLYTWCRDHRLHHKFSETDADPHNSKRGFFFCHVGWLLTRKHPDIMLKGKTLDCSDLLKDPVIRFQRR